MDWSGSMGFPYLTTWDAVQANPVPAPPLCRLSTPILILLFRGTKEMVHPV